MHLLLLHDGAACVPATCALMSYKHVPLCHTSKYALQVAGHEGRAPEQGFTAEAACYAHHSWRRQLLQ